MWSGEEEYKTSCSWGVLIDCCSMQLLSHSHEKCSTQQCFVTFYSLRMTHICHLLPWVIHSRSAFNCRSTYVRCRLRCLGEPKVCRVRWPLICIHKTLLFSSPGEDEPICVVYLALDQTIFITLSRFPSQLGLLSTQEVVAFWISSKRRSIRTTRPLSCHYVDYIVYSKWKVLQYA